MHSTGNEWTVKDWKSKNIQIIINLDIHPNDFFFRLRFALINLQFHWSRSLNWHMQLSVVVDAVAAAAVQNPMNMFAPTIVEIIWWNVHTCLTTTTTSTR